MKENTHNTHTAVQVIAGGRKKEGGWQPFSTEHSDWSRANWIFQGRGTNFLYSRLNCTVLAGHRFAIVQCLFCKNGILNIAINLHVIRNILLPLNAFYCICLQWLLQILWTVWQMQLCAHNKNMQHINLIYRFFVDADGFASTSLQRTSWRLMLHHLRRLVACNVMHNML